jgi:hypothetical protein
MNSKPEWSNAKFTESSKPKMAARAAVAARLIEPYSSVLDVGCGLMLIRDHLPEGCEYAGFDRYPALPEVQPIDLDAKEFPPGHFDYVLLLGVLSWIKEREFTLRAARTASPLLIATRADDTFDAIISDAGWTLEKSLPHISNSGEIGVCLYR